MGKAEAGEDRGGARRRGMGADVGEPRLDLGDAMRVGRGLRLGEERAALAVGRRARSRSGVPARRAPPAAAGRWSRARARRSGPARARGRRRWRETACSCRCRCGRRGRPAHRRESARSRARSGAGRPRAWKHRRSPAWAWYGRNGREDATGSWCRGLDGLPTGRCCRHNPANRRVRPGRGGTKGDDMCLAGCERAVREAVTRRGFFRAARPPRDSRRRACRASAAIAAPQSFTTVVDLTHTMSPEFPTFNGKPGIEMQREFAIKKDGYNLYWWRVERACRHPHGRADPFLRARRDGGQARDRAIGGAARRRRHRLQGRAGRRLSAVARRSRAVGKQERPAAGRVLRRALFRLGRACWSPTRRDSAGATSTAPFIFRALPPRRRSG